MRHVNAVASSAQSAAGGQGVVVDLASEFLTTACHARPGAEFAESWLAYEERHRDFYDALYYTSPDYRAERATLAAELGPRRDEMCGYVRAFLVTGPGTVAVLRGRVAELLGVQPRARIYFSVPLQSRTDAPTRFTAAK